MKYITFQLLSVKSEICWTPWLAAVNTSSLAVVTALSIDRKKLYFSWIISRLRLLHQESILVKSSIHASVSPTEAG
jgi:hypothetical protein